MRKISVLLVIIAGSLWGTSGIFATNLRRLGFDSLQMALMRNVVSAVCLWIYCFSKHRDCIRVSPKKLVLFVLSGLGLYGTGAFYYAAMKAASISVAVVLMYLAPVIVMVYSAMFMGEKFTMRKLLAVVGALVGTALVTGAIGGVKLSLYGIALGLMSGISYSLYNICVKYEMKRGDQPLIAAAFCFLVAAVVSVALGKPVDTFSKICINFNEVIPWALSVGVVTSVVPYIVYTYAMKHLDAGVATTLGSVEPMVATVISVALYGEIISLNSYLGIFLILASVVLLSTKQ